MRLTTIELFAGAGGLALGVEKAGFKTLACLEFNADACASLRANRPRWRVVEDDIDNVSCLDLEDYLVPHDTVMEELRAMAAKCRMKDRDMAIAMFVYLLGFASYLGFGDGKGE